MNTSPDFYTERDDYGRTCHKTSTHRGVIVRLPKSVTDPAKRYMVNLLTQPMRNEVHYFETLPQAKSFFASQAVTR